MVRTGPYGFLESRTATTPGEVAGNLYAGPAVRWGWERTGHSRKVVWAELALCVSLLG